MFLFQLKFQKQYVKLVRQDWGQPRLINNITLPGNYNVSWSWTLYPIKSKNKEIIIQKDLLFQSGNLKLFSRSHMSYCLDLPFLPHFWKREFMGHQGWKIDRYFLQVRNQICDEICRKHSKMYSSSFSKTNISDLSDLDLSIRSKFLYKWVDEMWHAYQRDFCIIKCGD